MIPWCRPVFAGDTLIAFDSAMGNWHVKRTPESFNWLLGVWDRAHGPSSFQLPRGFLNYAAWEENQPRHKN